MDGRIVKLLAEYNRKTNADMNRLVAALTPAQWEQPFGGYYPSIRALCNHLCNSDFVWLNRFGTLRPFLFLQDGLFQREARLDANAFATLDEYLELRGRLDEKLSRLAEEVTPQDLEAVLVYKNFKGVDQRRNVGGLLLHMFNHQTHHRGMISVYLDCLGVQNDYSNLLNFV